MKKPLLIFLNSLPVLIMIGLIPLVSNDYLLAGIYTLVIIISLLIKHARNDLLVLAFGFVIMIIFEYFFISTGVETFNRNTLFGMMPIWLPFLWAYGFVAIRRSIEILNENFS